jgi:uncharacterized protein (TIGR03083 family)
MDAWEVNERERIALADDLSTVPEPAWETQSLCANWRVRDVVAHVIAGATTSKREWFRDFAKSGFNFNRFIARDAIARGRAEPAGLLDLLRSTASSRNVPPGATRQGMLNETICHAQDIRRPLGLDHEFPTGALEAVADSFKGKGYPFGSKQRIAGVRLVATDAPWTTGQGPEVSGPLEALVMVMAGRRSALADLTGPATSTIEARFKNS